MVKFQGNCERLWLTRQFVLVEEFQPDMHSHIRTQLDERKVKELYTAATTADDYALTHKIFLHKPSFPTKSNAGSSSKPCKGNRWLFQGPPENSHPKFDVFKPVDQKLHFPGVREPTTEFSSRISCDYCKRRGHLISHCCILERRNRSDYQQKATPTGLAIVWNCTLQAVPLEMSPRKDVMSDLEVVHEG